MTTPKLPPPSEAETRILQAMNELQERLKIERTKSAALVELRAFVEKRPLLTRHVLWGFVKSLPDDKAKRGKRAVKSTLTKNKPKPENAKIAAAITRGREDKGLSRKALADKLGMNEANVHWWEKAKGKPSPEFRAKVERALGIKLPQPNGHASP
jgi:DNA-binding transcriptional regulator YiaG